MYTIKLTLNGTDMMIDHSHGYEIKTITGLNGLSSKISTVQSRTGVGEAFDFGTLSGINIRVDGYILDNNTTAKEALRSHVLPLAEGTLTVYSLLNTEGAHRLAPYRKIGVVVKTAPTISAERHSKFSFTLYAPKPVFEEITPTRIILTANADEPASINVAGETDCEFTLTLRSAFYTFPTQLILYLDGTNTGNKSFELDFLSDPDYSTWVSNPPNIAIYRDTGDKLHVTINGVERMDLMAPYSDFLMLPKGTHTIQMDMPGGSGNAFFEYTPVYYGVVINGN